MGFWAGFMQQYNIIKDRKERKELLMQEIGSKRQDAIIKLLAAKGKRTKVAGDERAALKALASRVGDADGGREWLSAIAQANMASETLKGIRELELDNESKELSLRGEALINAVTPFYDDETGKPNVNVPQSLEEIIRMNPTDFANDDVFGPMYASALQEAEGGGQQGVIDIDPQKVHSGNNKLRREALEYFDQRLIEAFSPLVGNQTTQQNVELVSYLEDLGGDNKTAASRARSKLMLQPQTLEIYRDMVNNQDIPSYNVIRDMGGEFDVLGEASDLVDQWDRFDPNEQEDHLTRYGFLKPFFEGTQ